MTDEAQNIWQSLSLVAVSVSVRFSHVLKEIEVLIKEVVYCFSILLPLPIALFVFVIVCAK